MSIQFFIFVALLFHCFVFELVYDVLLFLSLQVSSIQAPFTFLFPAQFYVCQPPLICPISLVFVDSLIFRSFQQLQSSFTPLVQPIFLFQPALLFFFTQTKPFSQMQFYPYDRIRFELVSLTTLLSIVLKQ